LASLTPEFNVRSNFIRASTTPPYFPAMAGKRQKRSTNSNIKEPVVLVIDVGGSKIKLRKSDSPQRIKFKSGRKTTPDQMVTQALLLTANWDYDVVSIGFPGPVVHGKPVCDPQNLGKGWVNFDFRKAFRKPVKLINDAAMQALGSYQGGRMLFIGLGTGLGSALIVDDVVVPLELGEIRYSRGKTLEDLLGKRGLKKIGGTNWRKAVHAAIANLKTAFVADYVMIGGGNVKKLRRLPPDARRGSNHHAFCGGVRLWQETPISAKVKKHTLILT
jgi:polyphosphate glucokinase